MTKLPSDNMGSPPNKEGASREHDRSIPDGSSLDAARSYLKRGWSPIPIPHGAKAPVLKAWQKLEQLLRLLDGQRILPVSMRRW